MIIIIKVADYQNVYPGTPEKAPGKRITEKDKVRIR